MRRILSILLLLPLTGPFATYASDPADGAIHVCAHVANGKMRLVNGPEDCKRAESYHHLASYEALLALQAQLAALEERVAALEEPPAPPFPPGAVAYWSFDDQVNPTADPVGDHNATVFGALFETTDIPPVPGNVAALRLNRESGDYAFVPDPDGAGNLDGFAAFTLASWVNPGEETGSQSRVIISKYNSYQGNASYSLNMLVKNPRMGAGVWGGAWDTLRATNTDLQLDHWQHVAGTWDGQHMRLYVNGVEVASKETTAIAIEDNSVPVNIGAGEAQADGNRAFFFKGLLDEVAIFNRALTADEIGALAAGARP